MVNLVEVLRYLCMCVWIQIYAQRVQICKANEHRHVLQLFSLGGFVIVVPFTTCEPVIFHILFFGPLCQRGSIYHVKKKSIKNLEVYL